MKKIKLPKLRFIKNLVSVKAIIALIFIVFSVGISFLGWFLYNDFYRTISYSQDITVLRNEVSPYTVNLQKFNITLQALQDKIAATSSNQINWQEIKNPFSFTPTLNRPETLGID